MLDNARRHHPEYWEVLTDGGVLHDELLAKLGDPAPFGDAGRPLAAE
jgi:hypothetical protein